MLQILLRVTHVETLIYKAPPNGELHGNIEQVQSQHRIVMNMLVKALDDVISKRLDENFKKEFDARRQSLHFSTAYDSVIKFDLTPSVLMKNFFFQMISSLKTYPILLL